MVIVEWISTGGRTGTGCQARRAAELKGTTFTAVDTVGAGVGFSAARRRRWPLLLLPLSSPWQRARQVRPASMGAVPSSQQLLIRGKS